MTPSPLTVQQRGPIRWVLLNRPDQRNAINSDLTEALAEQLLEIESDDSTSVVILAGEGPSFCAGGDFRYFLELDDADGADAVVRFLTRLSHVVTGIEHSTKPWVAALHGHAIAGGLELALACDVVLASAGTLIGDGHVNNKLLPGAGSSVRLENAVGRGIARWMHLSGQPVPAEDLAQAGWLHDVTAADELRDRAQEVAEQLAAIDPCAQRGMKSLLVSIAGEPDNEALQTELEAFDTNWRSNAVANALREFLEARRAKALQRSYS